MKRVACAAVLAACVSVSGTVFAADLSLKDTPAYESFPATIWTGLYVGGHVGGAWGDVDVTDVNELNTIDPHANVSISTSGLLYGGQIGYNKQRGNIVYGVEADIGYMNLDGSASAHMQDNGSGHYACDGYHEHKQQCALDSKYSVSGGLYGDLTARVGYANDKALFYVKGGAAFLNVDVNAHYNADNCTNSGDNSYCSDNTNPNPSTFDFSKSETMWGWTIGLGVEYAISRSLSLKAEYQHFDFGTLDMSYTDTYNFAKWDNAISTLTGDSETDVTVDAVSVGLNYRFNGGADPLK
ncbi:MAG: outer membrane beta-barrel protein [Alphaproteobacteria bacterium]